MSQTTGIVIEGGAMRSVFAAGILDLFMDKGVEIPNILAVSAGAYAGMNYVSGQRGRAVDAVIKPLEEECYLGMGTFLKKGTFFDMDFLFEVVPKLRAPFDFEAFKNSTKRFMMNTTNCLTGQCVYYDSFESQDQFWNICKAANSMPFISRISQIDGVPMLDGGMADALPVLKALEEGWEKLIIILTRKNGYRKKYRRFYMTMLRIFYRKYPEFIRTVADRANKYNASLDKIARMEKEGKALVFRPWKLTVENSESHVDTLMEYYRHGYDEANERIQEVMDFLK